MTAFRIMQFNNQIKSTGEKPTEGYYESVTKNGITLSVGDFVVWSDPDAGMHVGECELVSSEEWVVEVKRIMKSYDDYDGEFRLRIAPDGPLGWLKWEDLAIPNEKGNFECMADEAANYVETFHNSEYDRWMARSYHLGKGGVPDDLWHSYSENTRGAKSGPHCEYCTGDQVQIRGE